MSLQPDSTPSPIQISSPLTDYDTVYEITLAFSTKLYSIKESWDAIPENQKRLNDWLRPHSQVEKVVYCTEYTKKFQPHVHIAVCCTEPLPLDVRHGIASGLRRTNPETRVTFSQVVSKQSFNDYLEKDLDKNYTKYNINHKSEFTQS